MAVEKDWSIDVSLEELFRSQRMDLERMRARRPELVRSYAEALQRARDLLEPVVISRQVMVTRVDGDGLVLQGGGTLVNRFLAGHLAKAEAVLAAVCSIGPQLDREAARAFADQDYLLGYALDSVGVIALNHLETQFYVRVEGTVARVGKKLSCRYSPGLPHWPVDRGQPEIFALLPECAAYVELLPGMQMVPLKSVSWLAGVGSEFPRINDPCELCSRPERCAYRAGYGAQTPAVSPS